MVYDPIKKRAAQQKYRESHRAEINANERMRNHASGRCRPLSEAKESGAYLGDLAERILSRYFENLKRMPFGNSGYDFICNRGFKIDCKCSCIHPKPNSNHGMWTFGIHKNEIADYFLCLAFDDRENLSPLHIWLIPGNEVSKKHILAIYDSDRGLARWGKYEKSLGKVHACCALLH